MGDDNLLGLFIPIGVAHGFFALSDVALTYLCGGVNHENTNVGKSREGRLVRHGSMGCRSAIGSSGVFARS